MKKRKLWQAVLLAVAVSVFGCSDSSGEKGTGEEKTSSKKQESKKPAVKLRVGHVGHDHHTALFAALDNWAEYQKQTGLTIKKIEDRKTYELYEDGRKLADLEIIKVGGGSKMPAALARGVIEVGLGGTAAVLSAFDKGAPVKLISPLHSKGDMFVLRPDFPAGTWKEFVAQAKKAKEPILIGYKNPKAVAKIIFEDALKHAGVSFGGPAESNVRVQMINVKGGRNLNLSLASKIVDGYAGNNPFPAIGEEKGILKVIEELENLPPGSFKNHPCCCVGAHEKAISEKAEAISALLKLMKKATATINADLDRAAKIASRWIGTSVEVEKKSIPTSGYSMEATPEWHAQMKVWVEAMNGLGVFGKRLKGKSEAEVTKAACDFSLLEKAEK